MEEIIYAVRKFFIHNGRPEIGFPFYMIGKRMAIQRIIDKWTFSVDER